MAFFKDYILHCCCLRLPVISRWKDSEVKTCGVSDSAYRRGYGSPEEVVLFSNQQTTDLSTHFNLKRT